MPYTLDEINSRVKNDPQAFVDECEAAAQDRISAAADAITANMSRSPIVLLAGPSGSGKTTTAKKIETELERRGINSHTVSMDNYFKTIDPETAPRTKKGDIDYESPLCLDMELLNRHFHRLSRGEEIKIPYFIFSKQRRSNETYTPMRLAENEIAIFEGIHAFNDVITDEHPEAFNLYISVDSRIEKGDEPRFFRRGWIRMLRRIVRDDKFRGTSAEATLRMWANVIASENKNILANVDKADMHVDTLIPYEVPLLKQFALPLLESVPADQPWMPMLPEIISRLKEFETLDEKYVRPESLLREFIGNGIYDY